LNRSQSIVLVRWMMDREIALCRILNRVSRAPKIKKLFILISILGDGKGWYVLMLSLPFLYGDAGMVTSWNMVRVGVVNLALYKIIKGLAGRPRPCAVSADITLGTAPLDQYSFPSGHTMHAMAFSMIATAHHGELVWLLAAFTSLIALSRVILGLHYPTDVVAGGVIGGSVASNVLAS